MTIQEAIVNGTRLLTSISNTPGLDAEVLTARVLRQPHEYVFSHPEQKLTAAEQKTLAGLIQCRQVGWPVAYLTKEKEFYGFLFFVDQRVLIPRPSTETLIDAFVRMMKRQRRKLQPLVADVGSGSGAIAVVAKKLVPKIQMVAVDLDRGALAVTRKNAKLLGAKIDVKKSNLLNAFRPGSIQIVLSNLPYLTSKEASTKHLKYEPRFALDGGKDGLNAFRRLFDQAPRKMAAEGVLILEIGWNQAKEIKRLARAAFPGCQITVTKDLAGFDRVITIRRRKQTKTRRR